MKKDFVQPSQEDFSHPDFQKIYDWKIVELLAKYMINYYRVWDEFKNIKEEYNNVIETSLFNILKEEIESQLTGFHKMFKGKSEGEQLFFDLFGKKGYGVYQDTCELCEENEPIHGNHIIQRPFFGRQKNKMLIYKQAQYRDHLLNITFICANCHAKIHGNYFISKRKLNKLIKRRRNVNRKSTQLLDGDINYLIDILEELVTFPDEFEAQSSEFFADFFDLEV